MHLGALLRVKIRGRLLQYIADNHNNDLEVMMTRAAFRSSARTPKFPGTPDTKHHASTKQSAQAYSNPASQSYQQEAAQGSYGQYYGEPSSQAYNNQAYQS